MTYDHHQALVDRLRCLARDMEAYVAGRHNPRDNQISRWADRLRRIADECDPAPPWQGTGDGAGAIELTDAGREYGRSLDC